ncbi:MAG: sugar transferase [Ignavibacteriales bacterium]|nr:MAG: sugar transferase [Ignavibacteriales bacterium]
MLRMPKYKYYFAISDFMILSVSFIIAANIIVSEKPKSQEILSTTEFFLFIALSVTVIYLFDRNNLYKINVILKRSLHLTALVKSLFFAVVTTSVIFIIFYFRSATLLSLIALFFIFSSSLLFYLLRIEFYRRMILKLKNNFFQRNIIIAGGGCLGKEVADVLMKENPYGVNIAGFLDDNLNTGMEITAGKKVLGRIEQVKEISSSYQADEVIIAINRIEYERLLRILDYFDESKLTVKLASYNIVARNFTLEKYSNIPVADITPSRKKPFSFLIKRAVDMLGALTGLIILSPLILLVILLIKVGSPGPILFKQTRIGQNGRPFTFYKFRSMYVIDGEDEERKQMMIDFMKNNRLQAEDTKIINDKRVTWIGKYIRRTSIDELPQLYNVIKGDMSLVGPRPCLPYEYDNYSDWQKRRVDILPGCTGVWQISGRSSVSFNDSVLLDLYYINNLSLLFDIKILLKTIPVMFLSKGGK